MKAQAELLQPGVHIDAKKIRNALQDPQRIEHNQAGAGQRHRRDDGAEHGGMKQDRLARGVKRYMNQPCFKTGQRMTVADDVVEDSRQSEHEQPGRQRGHDREHQQAKMPAIRTDKGPHPGDQAQDIARTHAMRIRKIETGDRPRRGRRIRRILQQSVSSPGQGFAPRPQFNGTEESLLCRRSRFGA